MQRIGRDFLVPVLVTAIGLSSFYAKAHAEAVAADQAMVLLSKSQAMDTKCKFLAATEHDELSNLVARAELSLAARASVAVASSSLAKGRLLGQAATCSDADRAELSTVIAAAKTAATQVPVEKMEEPKMAASQQIAATSQPVVAAKKAMPQKVVSVEKVKSVLPSKTKPVALKKAATANSQGMAQYAAVTTKYYLVRRCGTMSAKSISALYQNVVSIHRASLQTFGRAPVADAMRRAEAQANAQSCK
jgi:hypothetical protein